MRITIKAQLLEYRLGQYSTYVFRNLDEPEDSWYKYTMVTMCPNWNYSQSLEVDDIGYLEYEIAKSGDEYYLPDGSLEIYRYSNTYFINFIKEQDHKQKEFEF